MALRGPWAYLEVIITDVSTASLILAMLNFIEFALCVADWWRTPSSRNWWAALSWMGSTLFWIVRGSMPV